MPVPSVMTSTVPSTNSPAPKRASARPAASASLMTSTGRPRRAVSIASMSISSQGLSTLAAEWTRTVLDDAGKGDAHGRVRRRGVGPGGQLGDDLGHDLGHGFGGGGLRRGHAEAGTDEFPLLQVHDPALDPGPADVDADQRGVLLQLLVLLGQCGSVRGRGRGWEGAAQGRRVRAAIFGWSGNQGRVRTSAPDSVTSRVCSNCAVRLRSRVTTVQSSAHMSQSTVPSVSMGSIVKTIPASMTVL